MKNAIATSAFLLSFVLAPAAAQDAPTIPASSVSGPLKLGRFVFALPPGQWQLIPVEGFTTTTTGEGARRPVARMLAVQVDPASRRLKSAAFFMATQVTAPNISSWNGNACNDPPSPLHRDMLDGNFNFPACLVTDYWIVPATPTGSVGPKLVEWLKANDIAIPGTLLWSRYVKYQGGDFVWAVHYVNPEAFGMPASVERTRVRSEWNPAALKGDAVRSDYLEQFKKWGYAMSASARATLIDGTPREEALPALPAPTP